MVFLPIAARGQVAPQFSCTAQPPAPFPAVRAEGLAEPVEFVVKCTGGTPTPAGGQVPAVSITVFLDTAITTRTLSSGDFSDALLIIDEPHSAAHPNTPILVCGAAGSNEGNSGQCTITGDGTGSNTYSGSAGHPNIFQGAVTSGFAVWRNVPIDPPGQGTRTLRFTNLRANVSQFNLSETNLMHATISISPNQNLPFTNPVFGVALVDSGLTVTATPMSMLSPCTSANPNIAADSSKPLDSGGQNGAQFAVTFREGFGGAFRPKNVAQAVANQPSGTFPSPSYPADQNQNVPAFHYGTETQFFNGAAADAGLGVSAPTTHFPVLRGLDKAGLADQGARLYVSFSSIPSGMKLFVPVVIALTREDSTRVGTAVLIATDTNGGGVYSAIAGNASGLAAIPTNGSVATAVYEVVYNTANPGEIASLTVPVAAAYAAGAPGAQFPAGLQIGVTAGFAPLSTIQIAADSGTPVPRFGVTPTHAGTAFLVQSCNAPDLTVSMTHSGAFAPDTDGTFSITVKNSGDQPTSGLVTLATTGAYQNVTAVNGSGWTCPNSQAADCHRSDPLAAGAVYPPIVLSVHVDPLAPVTVTRVATAGGGGETVTANNSASDTVNTAAITANTIGTSPAGLLFTVDGFTYSATTVFYWPAGSAHIIATAASQQNSDGTAVVFNRWSDTQSISHTITVGSTPVTYTAIFESPASTPLCLLNGSGTPTVPQDGVAVLVGDVVLTCIGGTPTSAGMPVPQVDIRITLNTGVTSRRSDAFTEALLIVDDPHSPTNPARPLLVCGAPNTNDNGSGVCPITSTGDPRTTYDGSPGHPNVFQSQFEGTKVLVFKGIPVDAPGAQPYRVFRVVNIRANGSVLPPGSALIPTSITASVAITPGGMAVSGEPSAVAYMRPGLVIPTPVPAALSQCAPANPSIAADAVNPLDSGEQNGQQFSIRIDEGYASSWGEKNIQWHLSNSSTSSVAPADSAQDVPGSLYYSQSGFEVNGISPSPITGPIGYGPFLTANTAFPVIRGLNTAGTSDSGSRFYVEFSGVPAGVRLFVPVRLPLKASWTILPGDGLAVLISNTHSLGRGAFWPVDGNTAGLTELPVTSGVASATYEIVYTDPLNIESATIPVAVAWASGSTPPTGDISVQVFTGPFTGVSAFPRFARTGSSTPAVHITSCAPSDLTIAASHSNNFAPGAVGATATLTVTNVGPTATSAQVTVVYALSAGLTATNISGTGWTCALPTLTCTRGDVLAPSASYPPITLTVNVAGNAPASLSITATVSGGGETNSSNSSVTDVISVGPPPATTITSIPAGIAITVDGTTYTSPHTFNWPVASTHTIATPDSTSISSVQYAFMSWSDSAARSHTITAGAVAATYTATYWSTTTPYTCLLNGSATPTVRSEGRAELVGDVVLTCTGGTPTPLGAAILPTDIRVYLNANVTSRLTGGGFTEALLIIDEPHSPSNPSVPLLACGDGGSNDDGTGVCPMTGNGGSGVYSGAAGRPNVFQGRLEGANVLVWKAVPIDPPGPSKTRILRFTNIRANANQLGIGPIPIVANLSVAPQMALPISNPQGILALISRGLTAQVGTAPVLPQCASVNPSLASNPAAAVDSGLSDGLQFVIRLYPSAAFMKEKNIQGHLSTTPSSRPASIPSDAAQDVPGGLYYSESGFLVNGVTPAPSVAPSGFGPFLPANAAFPAVRGLSNAGKSDSGTRFMLTFQAIPAGVKLFAPVFAALYSGTPPVQHGIAVLVSANSTGGGAYLPVMGNASNLAPLTVTNGTATAVYEIVHADPFVVDEIRLPFALAYLANQPAVGKISVSYSFGPLDSTAVAGDFNIPVPRFAPSAAPLYAFDIQSCTPPDLTVSMTHTSSTSPREFIATVSNTGLGLTAGTVHAVFGAEAALQTVALFGNGWSCTPSTLVCTRADSLPAGASYPPITFQVLNVATPPLSAEAWFWVDGGNQVDTTNDYIADPINIGTVCPVTLGSIPSSIPATGGAYTVSITAAGGCAWKAISTAGWLGFTGTSSGTATGSVNIIVGANARASRAGRLYVNGQILQIAQNGSFTNTTAIAQKYYQDLLGRDPDSTGLAYWSGLLLNGSYTRESLAAQFFLSPEFSQRGLLAIKTYNAILGRMPEYAGFRYWVSQLNAGLAPLDFVSGFIGSPEYLQRFGNPDNGTFVTLMYQNVLGRSPDSAGLAFWTNELGAGAQTRTTLMYAFITSVEYDNLIRNRAYALLLYIGFLARDPDQAGFNYWLEVLNQGTPLASVISSFVFSPEYQSRF